jgi:hypothetical protein
MKCKTAMREIPTAPPWSAHSLATLRAQTIESQIGVSDRNNNPNSYHQHGPALDYTVPVYVLQIVGELRMKICVAIQIDCYADRQNEDS